MLCSFLLFMISLGIPSSSINGESLAAHLTCNLDIYPRFLTGDSPNQSKEAVEALVEEARYIFSGIIYGFAFKYTPANRKTKRMEAWILTPVSMIPVGDPSLKSHDAQIIGNQLDIHFTYSLSEEQRHRRKRWNTVEFPTISGVGIADAFIETERLQKSIEDALKRGVHNHYSSFLFHKPRTITGWVALTSPPIISFSEGQYTARCEGRIEVSEIL